MKQIEMEKLLKESKFWNKYNNFDMTLEGAEEFLKNNGLKIYPIEDDKEDMSYVAQGYTGMNTDMIGSTRFSKSGRPEFVGIWSPVLEQEPKKVYTAAEETELEAKWIERNKILASVR